MPNPDGSQDKFLCALHGEENGDIFLDGQLLFSGDIPGMREVEFGDLIPTDPAVTDTLKISGCRRLIVKAKKVVGGKEDVLDINHSHQCEVRIEEAVPRGRFVGTTKGGSSDILVVVGKVTGRAKETEFDFGNWSDQSNAKTGPCAILVGESTEGVVRARLLNAAHISTGGSVTWKRNTTWNGIFLPFYKCVKFLKLDRLF